jgi:pyruvate,water dikinase
MMSANGGNAMRSVTVQFVEFRSTHTPVAVPAGLTPLAHAVHRDALQCGRTEAAGWLAAPDPTALDSLADEWAFAWQPEIQAVLPHAQSTRLTCLPLARLLDHLTWATRKLNRVAAISAYARRVSTLAQAKLIAVAPQVEALLPDLLKGWMTNEVAAHWALWQLSREAQRLPGVLSILQRHSAGDAWAVLNMSSEADDFVADVRAWALAHGRRVTTLDATSAWEDPAQVIATVQTLLHTISFDGFASDDAREAAESTLRADVKEAVQRAQRCWIVARDAEWGWQNMLCEVRLIVREIGRRLARAGVIEKSADAFYLSLDELLAAAGDLHDGITASRKSLVARRRALHVTAGAA